MELNKSVVVGISFTSLAVGSIGGYFYAKKTLTKKIQAWADEEIAEAKRIYKTMYKKDEFETPEAMAQKLLGMTANDDKNLQIFDDTVETMRVEATQALRTYSPTPELVAPLPVEAPPDSPDPRGYLDEGDDMAQKFDYDTEVPKRDPHNPYIISVDEYFENATDYSQVTIDYYTGDGILTEDDDVLEIRKTIGSEDNLKFGKGTPDHNIVYIRNDRLCIDYEVRRVTGKYSVIVAGLDDDNTVMDQMQRLRSKNGRLPARERFSAYRPEGVVGAGDQER